MHWLIATDLDGTLLDDGYHLEAAAAAIDALFRLRPVAAGVVNLHVVLATSKTFVETVTLADHCACDPVLAFENGAGLAWRTAACAARGSARRDGYEIECPGMDHARLRHELLRLRRHPDFDFRGFGDMSAAEIGARTGLAEDAAAAARQRMASEALLWQGSPAALEAFRAELATLGLSLDRGGRFHHVMPQRSGKAGAVARIRHLIARRPGEQVTTLACGDAPNDAGMMRAADFALVFPGRNGQYLLAESTRVAHAPGAGASDWLKSVSSILEAQSPRV